MDLPCLISRTSLFTILGTLGGTFLFYVSNNLKSIHGLIPINEKASTFLSNHFLNSEYSRSFLESVRLVSDQQIDVKKYPHNQYYTNCKIAKNCRMQCSADVSYKLCTILSSFLPLV